ncbi:UDP-3-O-acyl-N-acetylglucosamine deacetylase [Qingshengfaniella alkalisoli]|uniref:UDP-3-O-acyl-N-acetylglucosamine deacetylase n=1 Tax=Qingshengfaniella alkalisoli TaxID=2599296 RepID=A0A5B8I717_9RHOB|nr:UDP-3-O-acyl-N-acetylglucosamine deacetylase [Qingshengfaniella alkalisoli]QDY69445.1 UDP-3-O-acyl-N-acetylglucosamine deacetylase [Qingshengfaniella alkalisoli]
MQTTLKTIARFTGTGLHTGRPVRLSVHPAKPFFGIRFRRTDVRDADQMIFARWDFVEQTSLCTKVVNKDGISVSTIEHIMAALAGVGIHNALIDIDGPEIPILDGSAAPFVRGLMNAGLDRQDAPVRAIRILKPVEVCRGQACARLEPSEGLEIDFSIDFADEAIGRQSLALNMHNGTFIRELCDSRTFCLQSDVDVMRANGLALGGSTRNAVVFDDGDVLSPGGLRHSDEPVRHKMLDALGDLATAGAPILGRYVGIRSGHSLTNELLRTLFADDSAWCFEECDTDTASHLPGVGVSHLDLTMCA